MKRIHIIGQKNHGKTGLVEALVEELTERGLRVGTVKHTHHRHELDTPGKDSHRHRLAGAAVVGVLSGHETAVFIPTDPDRPKPDRYAEMSPMFATCDIVIVEGDSSTEQTKVEVWRDGLGTRPLAERDPTIVAVVTDDPVSVNCPVMSRSDIVALATELLRLSA